MRFEFATATRIYFGPGVVSEAARENMDRIPVRRPGDSPLPLGPIRCDCR